jgi:hypothetical protein
MANQSFKEINDIIEAIPERTFGGAQPEFLFNLSMKLSGNGEVVEIGTNVGKSTIVLAFAQKCKNEKPLTTIDLFQHPAIQKNLEVAGVKEFVNRIISPSKEAAAHWNRPIKLLWIDGDHSCSGVYNDIKAWSRFVLPNGIIALHDYPGHQGSKVVARAIAKSVLMNPYRFRILYDREAGSIIVFQRIKSVENEDRGIPSRLYWYGREIRSWLIETFPRLAQLLIRKVKEKKFPVKI